MPTIAIDDPGVCLSVSQSRGISVQTRLNRSTLCLSGDSWGPKETPDPIFATNSMRPSPNYFSHLLIFRQLKHMEAMNSPISLRCCFLQHISYITLRTVTTITISNILSSSECRCRRQGSAATRLRVCATPCNR